MARKEVKLGLPQQRVGGRFVTAYEPALALLICERIAEGETLKGICEEGEMPSRQTFHRWVVNQPELSRAYASARELSAHSMEEEALDIARQLSSKTEFTSAKIQAFDKAMGQLRWSASRRNPKTYSERGAVQITVPIQINTSLDMGDGGMAAADHPDIYSIEAKLEGPVEEPIPDSELMKLDTKPMWVTNPTGVNRTSKWDKIRKRMDAKEAEQALEVEFEDVSSTG